MTDAPSTASLNQAASPNHATPSRITPNRIALVLGLALALAATDPVRLTEHNPVGWLVTVPVLVGAIWGAQVVAKRPATESVRWTTGTRIARHRNTIFAVACTLVAGSGDPPVWLMAVDAALLLAYLLAVDALAAGPIGIRQLRRPIAPAAAALASAITLVGARAPINSGTIWGRIIAVVAVAAAALAASAALWMRQQTRR